MLHPCPVSVARLRRAIEVHVLQIYESDHETLKPPSEWPGHLTTSGGALIPGVFVEDPDSLPRDWNPEGVICTITGTPRHESRPSVGFKAGVETWYVMFSNFGIRESVTLTLPLTDIQRRLHRVFPSVHTTNAPRTAQTLASLTATIKLTTMQRILPLG